MAGTVPASWTEAPATRVKYVLRDAEGKQSSVTIFFDNAATSLQWQAIADAIVAISGLAVVSLSATTEYGWLETLPANAPYENAEDKAVLVVPNTTVGKSVDVAIPGPLLATFESDGETVTTGAGQGWVAALNANDVVNSDGLGTGTWVYLRGYFKRAKTRRKFSPGYATETGGD